MTRETLATDTPAIAATSWIVAITASGNRLPSSLYPTRYALTRPRAF
jgi:hypothetical protein